MLSEEIEKAQRLVRTDAYQMSVGELVSMYEDGELIIDPEFQRLFRWTISQKSKLIESILLGIPLPSIFIFERESGVWELIDGLQRLSTILEFMGKLKLDGTVAPPSILEATKYLPSLHNAVWDRDATISTAPIDEQQPLEKTQQLSIRRSRIGVEILKRPSDENTKYDLFQRLNAGGTPANAQELRNCIMIMINREFFNAIKQEAEREYFKKVLGITDDQMDRQRHIEMAVRFLVHTNIPYDGQLDVEEFIDGGIVSIIRDGNISEAVEQINFTFNVLHEALGDNALRRYQDGRHIGKVGHVALETIAVGIAKNITAIKAKDHTARLEFISNKAKSLWSNEHINSFTSPGMRGTTRIQRTVPFGESWFSS